MTPKEICELKPKIMKLGTMMVSLWNHRAGNKPLKPHTLAYYCKNSVDAIRLHCPETAEKCDRILKTHKEKDVEKEVDQTLDLAHDLGLLIWLHLEDEPEPESAPEPEPEPDEEPRILYIYSGLQKERRTVQDFLFHRTLIDHPSINPGWVLGYKGRDGFRTIRDPKSFGRKETWIPDRTQPSFDDYRVNSDDEPPLAFLEALSYPGSVPCSD